MRVFAIAQTVQLLQRYNDAFFEQPIFAGQISDNGIIISAGFGEYFWAIRARYSSVVSPSLLFNSSISPS